MRSAATALALALVAALGAVAVAQAAEPETNECANLASCTSIPNTPWVVVPAAKDGLDENDQGVIQPGIVLWRIDCPGTQIPAGRDFVVAEPEEPLLVNALIPPFNIGVTGASAANFFAFWQGRSPTTFKPLVGCVPKGRASARAGASRVRLRSVSHDLKPGQTKTFRHHCAGGEQLVHSEHGVAFHTEAPPSPRELKQLRVSSTENSSRVLVKVKTGAMVGDDERVELQIHAFCR